MLTNLPGGAGVHGSLPSVALNSGTHATGTAVVVVVPPGGCGMQAAARTTSTANGTADAKKRFIRLIPLPGGAQLRRGGTVGRRSDPRRHRRAGSFRRGSGPRWVNEHGRSELRA